MANKITHVNWHAAEDKCGKFLQKHQVCMLLGISEVELDEYYKSCRISTSFDIETGTFGFPIAEVKYFAETQLGIKDSSYEAGKEEAKNQATASASHRRLLHLYLLLHHQANSRSPGTRREEWKHIRSILSLRVRFEIASSSIKKYIQTQQKGGK